MLPTSFTSINKILKMVWLQVQVIKPRKYLKPVTISKLKLLKRMIMKSPLLLNLMIQTRVIPMKKLIMTTCKRKITIITEQINPI